MMQCSDVQMVRFGTYMLAEEVDDWWVSTQPILQNEGVVITWAVFRREFMRRYFPDRGKKEIEFLELKQGDMSITECHTLILDLKILTQIPLLFSNAFKSTVFSTVLQLHTLLFQSFEFLHKIIQKGILVISYKGTHFQSLQFVPESFLFVCINH